MESQDRPKGQIQQFDRRTNAHETNKCKLTIRWHGSKTLPPFGSVTEHPREQSQVRCSKVASAIGAAVALAIKRLRDALSLASANACASSASCQERTFPYHVHQLDSETCMQQQWHISSVQPGATAPLVAMRTWLCIAHVRPQRRHGSRHVAPATSVDRRRRWLAPQLRARQQWQQGVQCRVELHEGPAQRDQQHAESAPPNLMQTAQTGLARCS
jgi:hypothetical protein